MVRATEDAAYPFNPFIDLYGHLAYWPNRAIVHDKKHWVGNYIRFRDAYPQEIAAFDSVRIPGQRRPRGILFGPVPRAYISSIETPEIRLPTALQAVPAGVSPDGKRVPLFSENDPAFVDYTFLPTKLRNRVKPYFLDLTRLSIAELISSHGSEMYDQIIRASGLQGLRLSMSQKGWTATVISGDHTVTMEGVKAPRAVWLSTTIDGLFLRNKVSDEYPADLSSVVLPWIRMCHWWNDHSLDQLRNASSRGEMTLRDGSAEIANYILHGEFMSPWRNIRQWMEDTEKYRTIEFDYIDPGKQPGLRLV